MSSLLPENDVEPIDKIGWVMGNIMKAVEEKFELYGIELPELRYLTMATPVHDCAQVTVTLIQAYVGPPGDQAAGPQPCGGPRTGVFQVEVVRCFEDGSTTNLKRAQSTAVDPDVITTYALERARDVWTLLDAAGEIPDYNAVIADASLSEPLGKFQAAVLNLVVQI